MTKAGHRGRARWMAAVLIAGTVAPGSPAQSPSNGDDAAPSSNFPPAAARRIVRLFDFEDPRNPDPVPAGWERTTLTPDRRARPGFPPYNRAEVDNKIAFSGTHSVRLPTAGGSTALRLAAGEAAVYADADYTVSARVRTEGLEHARAFVTVRLLDQNQRTLPGSEVRSEPVIAPGIWREVSVRAPGGREGAAWLQIDLELLQPRQMASPVTDDPAAKALEKHRLYREDVRGSAWFDDVAIVQMPRAAIATVSPCNIVPASERPTLRMTVRDLGGEELRARTRVYDLRGRLVAEMASAISPDGRPLEFTPRLNLRGWYSARLDVITGAAQAPVSSAETRFVWLAPGPGGPAGGDDSTDAGRLRAAAAAVAQMDRARLGVIADDVPDDRSADLDPLLARLGTRFVYLPAWRPDSTLESAASSLSRRRPAIEALLRSGQEVTFTIAGVPSELSRATLVAADDPLALAAVPAATWMPYLAPTLDIFGQRVLRYQLGAAGSDQAFWHKSLTADVEALETALGTLVPGPVLGLPWPADRGLPSLARPTGAAPGPAGAPSPRPADAASAEARRALAAPIAGIRQTGPLVDALQVRYPIGFAPGEMPGALARLQAAADAAAPPEMTVSLELPPADQVGRGAVINELMRRAVEFWRALGDGSAERAPSGIERAAPRVRLALEQPWAWSPDGAPQVWPAPEAATLVVLGQRLCGRRIVGELTNVAGVKCYILAARNTALGTLDRGALVAWNESAEPSRAIVDAAAVGSEVTIVDAFGNPTIIPVPGGAPSAAGGAPGAGSLVTVPVGDMPVFIEGIDPYLALFAASFRLEPGFMPAVVREHEHRITLANPWPVRVTGKLQLKEDSDRTMRMRRASTDDWQLSPTGIIDFDIAPGQTQSLPVTLWYGPGQMAGVKDFLIVARVMADRAYPAIRLHASIEIGLEDIDMYPELQVASGTDVIVVASVTNKGTRTRTLRLETAAKNMPGQQLQVSDLPPGQTVLRRFVFKNAIPALSGKRIVVSLSDLEEAQRLNKAVLVP